jgi:antibiotic biosynthesis monooxygenase (ABM) superfamily enzyme
MSESTEHAVIMLISRRVKVGSEVSFEQICHDMMAAASKFAGYVGSQLVHPGEEPDLEDPLFHVMLAFDSAEHLNLWKHSSERRLGLAAAQTHIEGSTHVRHITGLAHWFKVPGVSPIQAPPKWKVAVVTWLGICPTVYLLFLLLGPLLAPWPLLTRTMLLTVLVVAAMTWLVAPQLTRTFKSWLYPKQ